MKDDAVIKDNEAVYALYQGDCSLLERGKLDAPELMIEEVRDEIMYTHNLGKMPASLSARRNLRKNLRTEKKYSHIG